MRGGLRATCYTQYAVCRTLPTRVLMTVCCMAVLQGFKVSFQGISPYKSLVVSVECDNGTFRSVLPQSTRSLTCSLIRSLTRSHAYSLARSLTHSLTALTHCTRSLTRSLTHCTRSLHSHTHSLTHSLAHSLHSLTALAHSLTHMCDSTLHHGSTRESL